MGTLNDWTFTLGILPLILVEDCLARKNGGSFYSSYRYTDENSDSWVAGAVVGGVFGFIVLITIIYICCQAGNCCCKAPKPYHRHRAIDPVSHIYTSRSVQSRPVSEISRTGVQIQTGDLRGNYSEFNPRGNAPVEDTPCPSYHHINSEPPPTLPGYRPTINVIPDTMGGRVMSPPPPYVESRTANQDVLTDL